MARVKVKAGCTLPHDGSVVEEGQIVDVPAHIVPDILHLVVPVDSAGRPIRPPTDIDAALARVLPHERISILRDLRAQALANVAELDALIAAEAPAAPVASKSAEARPRLAREDDQKKPTE